MSDEPRPGDTAIRPAAAGMLAADTVLAGRYRIRELLATGGMGEVYRAEHVELGRAFALKVMRPELAGDADFVDRFRKEAVACSRIGHPNIIDIVDFGRTGDGLFYFAMELLDGRTLGELVAAEGAQSVKRVRQLMAQLCHGLAAAHALGIVHRDLKPENVMLIRREGLPDAVKILDFGIAKVTGTLASGGPTAIGLVVGTPQYMSPEQAEGKPVDARTDIYSVGLILYELLTGRPAFDGSTPSLLIAKQVAEPPPPMVDGPIEPIPPGLRALVFRMLAKKPEQRPATMKEVLAALDPEGDAKAPTIGASPGFTPKQPVVAPAPLASPEPVRAPTSAPTRPEPVVRVTPEPKRWPRRAGVAVVAAVALAGLAVLGARAVPSLRAPPLVEPPPVTVRPGVAASPPVAAPKPAKPRPAKNRTAAPPDDLKDPYADDPKEAR